MSDIGIALLKAIDAVLTTEIAAGGRLEDVGSHFVCFTSAGVPPEYGAMNPLILVEMDTVSVEPISIPPCMYRKEYPVRFTVFTENSGDTEDNIAATLLDTLENIFFLQTFGLSQWVDVTSKNYSQNITPPFSGDWNGSATMTMTHVNTDVRSLPS